MTDYNDFLDDMELEEENDYGESFQLKLKNGLSEAENVMPVYPANTLGQIAEKCPKLIGTKKHAKRYNFEHGRTHRTESDTELTVSEFGLRAGDTLVVYDDGGNG